MVEGLCVEHGLALDVSIAAAVDRAIHEICPCDRGDRASLDGTGARRDGGQAWRPVVVESLCIGVILPVGRNAKLDRPCEGFSRKARLQGGR